MQIEIFFFVYSCLSHPQRSLYAPLKLTPLSCTSHCMSVLVVESVKLTLLRGVFVKSKTGHWTHRCLPVAFIKAHSNSHCTLLNCWINSTEQSNREEIPVELITILNHLIASLPNSKSAYYSVKPVKKDVWHKWKTKQTEQRQQKIIFPVVWSWRWKSHFIINTVLVGATVSSETDLFPSFMAVWAIMGLEEMHSEAQAHVYYTTCVFILIYLIYSACHFRNDRWEKNWAL